jgi:hypothetical protein
MPAQLETLPSRERSSRTENVARQWVLQFAELYSASLAERGPRFVELWVSAFLDLAPDALEAACRRAMQTCKFFPTPAEIRTHIENANGNGAALEIEEAWSRALDWVQQYFHPDLGVTRGAPELPAAIQHAMRAAGGMRWLDSCPASELQWAKKRFVEDFTRIHETQQSEHLLTRPEARRILSDLTTAEPKRQIHSGPAAEKPLPAEKPSREEVRGVLSRVTAASVTVEITEEEWESKKREQKRRLAEWRVARGLPAELTPEELRAAEAVGTVHKTQENSGETVAAK